VLGPSAVKRVFFQLPVRVELAPGGETKGVQLTVYEESDPEKVSKLFARRYGLPAAAAQRLQLEIVRQMELRTRLRVEVNLPGGGGRGGGGGEGAPATRLLTVRTGESTEQAARRFGLEHGLTVRQQQYYHQRQQHHAQHRPAAVHSPARHLWSCCPCELSV
jgi:hypothetical protein